MEIEGSDGSKTVLKPGSIREFGRGLGFTSDDRTVSRRQVSFQIHSPPDQEDETRVNFEVVGRNPIWVYSNRDGEVQTFRKSERGEMENGDMFCVSASKPIWFTLKRIDKRGAKKELEMETQLAESLQSSLSPVGIELDLENVDLSGIDPVQERINKTMDFDEPVAVYVEKVQNEETDQQKGYSKMTDEVGDREAHELKPSIHDSSAGKLFVGGIACETTKESFRKHFSQFGEVTNSELMMHKSSGWPRGFGFVTYADPEIADKVLEENHIIDGRVVEVKKTVPKEHVKGALNTKKFFVGGLPLSLTEDELKEYFSSYGNVVEHQIMLDQTTGRGRGFGFVRFDKEEEVEKVLSKGHMHKLCGKRVEIKRAEPKRAGADQHTSKSQLHCCACGGGGGSVDVFGGGYGGYGDYGGYGKFAESYGASPIGFYHGYGYGFWFGGGIYDAAGYGGSSYGMPAAYYGGGSVYGSSGSGLNDGGNVGYRGGGVNGVYANGRFQP